MSPRPSRGFNVRPVVACPPCEYDPTCARPGEYDIVLAMFPRRQQTDEQIPALGGCVCVACVPAARKHVARLLAVRSDESLSIPIPPQMLTEELKRQISNLGGASALVFHVKIIRRRALLAQEEPPDAKA